MDILGGTYLNNATYENVISLVVDPVLQHHFVHHGNEDLVLKIRGDVRKGGEIKGCKSALCCVALLCVSCHRNQMTEYPALVCNHQESQTKSLRSTFAVRCGYT